MRGKEIRQERKTKIKNNITFINANFRNERIDFSNTCTWGLTWGLPKKKRAQQWNENICGISQMNLCLHIVQTRNKKKRTANTKVNQKNYIVIQTISNSWGPFSVFKFSFEKNLVWSKINQFFKFSSITRHSH